MTRNIISAALIAAAAFAAAPSFAAGEADYNAQFPAAVSQRSRAEVTAEANKAARDAAVSVDAKSRVLPEVKSALTRTEVRQAAVTANRAGQLHTGELSF
ncbi:hypothetical protein PSQ20_12215 [Curvibacter sp. RS43]|uniref:hypothetical protein n=1 Tax=Curvibacter microcysteis TaxID=3026419 RepID=UPI00235F44B8|nr:hypothetical protein [Curvibacter sp. RS43]MDD0811110.1 hypothetical protein [Curvibacter sp. RS43]